MKYKLEVKSELKSLSVISDFLSESIKKYGITKMSVPDVLLAVDEACTNVIKHSYKKEEDGVIILQCYVSEDKFIVKIKDWGKPFEITSIQKPDLKADYRKRKIGGLGVYLMNEIMDEIEYSFNKKKGNILTMKKSIRGGT